MYNLSLIEEYYKKYINNLHYWIPEGIYTVDLDLLQRFGLLHFHYPEQQEQTLTRYFHVVESPEKITLINDEFVIWIMPDRLENTPVTYTLVAINHEDHPKLELAFIASGVYNTSKMVLRILDKFLFEIQDNEKMLEKLTLSA